MTSLLTYKIRLESGMTMLSSVRGPSIEYREFMTTKEKIQALHDAIDGQVAFLEITKDTDMIAFPHLALVLFNANQRVCSFKFLNGMGIHIIQIIERFDKEIFLYEGNRK